MKHAEENYDKTEDRQWHRTILFKFRISHIQAYYLTSGARTGRYISRAFAACVAHRSDHAERLLYKRISGLC